MKSRTENHSGPKGERAEVGIVSHGGREYAAGGAFVSDARLIAYLGDGGRLTDWAGVQIGTYRITSSWRTPRSFLSSTMNQVRARLSDGRTFNGRSGGVGLVFNGKRAAR